MLRILLFLVNFASYANILASPLPGEWQVSVPSSNTFLLEWVFQGCSVLIDGFGLAADLIPLELIGFDVILGMDFLSNHRALVDCFRKVVTFRSCGLPEFEFQGECNILPSCLISVLKAEKLLSKECQAFLSLCCRFQRWRCGDRRHFGGKRVPGCVSRRNCPVCLRSER